MRGSDGRIAPDTLRKIGIMGSDLQYSGLIQRRWTSPDGARYGAPSLWPAPDATTNAASRASRYAHRVRRNFIWNSFERGGGAAFPLRTSVGGSGDTHWGELAF